MAQLDLTRAPAPIAQKPLAISEIVRQKVSNVLQGKALDDFVTAAVSLVNSNPMLAKCDRMSFLGSCLQAQSLKLSLNQSLGQAWIIPYKDKATFVVGYKGLVQLAIRSGQYKRLNAIAIKEGELISWNPLTEELNIQLIEDEGERAKAETIGYYAALEYLNGFTKAIFWSRAKMEAHAIRYSMSYGYDRRSGKSSSFWTKDFDAMALKTMLRQLISKWGVMSVEMQTAYNADGRTATLQQDGNVVEGDFMDAVADGDTPEAIETSEQPAPSVEGAEV